VTEDSDSKTQDFERRSREALAQSAEGLSTEIRSRLTQARFAAIEEARRPTSPLWVRALVPAGGLTAAAVVALMAWHGATGDSSRLPGDSGRSDALEVIAMADDYDLLENDVEFYQWLDSEPDVQSVDDLTGAG
jgi:hypothetical protein